MKPKYPPGKRIFLIIGTVFVILMSNGCRIQYENRNKDYDDVYYSQYEEHEETANMPEEEQYTSSDDDNYENERREERNNEALRIISDILLWGLFFSIWN